MAAIGLFCQRHVMTLVVRQTRAAAMVTNVPASALLQTAVLSKRFGSGLIVSPNVYRNPKTSCLLDPTHECGAMISIFYRLRLVVVPKGAKFVIRITTARLGKSPDFIIEKKFFGRYIQRT